MVCNENKTYKYLAVYLYKTKTELMLVAIIKEGRETSQWRLLVSYP